MPVEVAEKQMTASNANSNDSPKGLFLLYKGKGHFSFLRIFRLDVEVSVPAPQKTHLSAPRISWPPLGCFSFAVGGAAFRREAPPGVAEIKRHMV